MARVAWRDASVMPHAHHHSTRRLTDLCLLSIVGIVAGCGSVVPTTGGSVAASATSTSSTAQLPEPCSFFDADRRLPDQRRHDNGEPSY